MSEPVGTPSKQEKPGKRRFLLPRRQGSDRRASALAVVLQTLLIALVVPALITPLALDWFWDDSGGPIIPERVTFQIALPTGGEPERRAPRDGGDGREASASPEAAPSIPPEYVAPTEVPGTVPAVPTEPRDPLGVGPLVGSGGPAQGIRPSFTDQRLWVRPSEVIEAPIVPLTRADTLRIMVRQRITAMVDSLAGLPADVGRNGDWTTTIKGQRVGIDQKMIRLGPVSIPTAVLAALPLNVQQNSVAAERARRLDSMREEIQWQVQRAARDDAFYAAVRALRERKERERQAQADSTSR